MQQNHYLLRLHTTKRERALGALYIPVTISASHTLNDLPLKKQGRIHGPKSLLEGRNAKASRTDRPADQRTDGRTHPLIESLRRV